MLDRDDIEADLGRGEPEDLRDAFDALIAWNGASAIAGVVRADELMALFERVCGAMLGDTGRVPPDTVQALSRGRGTPGLGTVTTYDGAARFALAARRTWWPAFAASFPDPA